MATRGLTAVWATESTPAPNTASPTELSPSKDKLRPEAGFTHSYLVKPPHGMTASSGVGSVVATLPPPPQQLPQGLETICHGLLRDPATGGGQPAPPSKMPDPLVFFSWWNEEVATPPEFTPSGQGMGLRRQVRLQYSAKTASFHLYADDVNAALSLAIEHSDGTPVVATELYVGAKLDVLGRPMTLRSAAARTIGWIDAEAKRMLKRREALCAQMAKFQDVKRALASVGIHQLYLNSQMAPTTQTAVPTGGKANLHRLHHEIDALEGLLVRYRS